MTSIGASNQQSISFLTLDLLTDIDNPMVGYFPTRLQAQYIQRSRLLRAEVTQG